MRYSIAIVCFMLVFVVGCGDTPVSTVHTTADIIDARLAKAAKDAADANTKALVILANRESSMKDEAKRIADARDKALAEVEAIAEKKVKEAAKVEVRKIITSDDIAKLRKDLEDTVATVEKLKNDSESVRKLQEELGKLKETLRQKLDEVEKMKEGYEKIEKSQKAKVSIGQQTIEIQKKELASAGRKRTPSEIGDLNVLRSKLRETVLSQLKIE